jgi:hypothetical protein
MTCNARSVLPAFGRPVPVAAALLASALWAALAASPVSAQTITSSAWADLADLASGIGGEPVLLTARVHVITQVTFPLIPNDPMRIDVRANLAQGAGIGLTTGLLYSATGADSIAPYFIPDGPPVLPPLVLGFRLVPEGPPGIPPDPILPLPLRLTLDFDELGNLVAGEVSVFYP